MVFLAGIAVCRHLGFRLAAPRERYAPATACPCRPGGSQGATCLGRALAVLFHAEEVGGEAQLLQGPP